MDRENATNNPIALARALIQRPSVTPVDAGALDVMQDALEALGFTCRRLPFDEVDNLYARLGGASPCFMFAGHTDVVPPGAEQDWQHPPFDAMENEGELWGRGAADMKGALAAMVAAVQHYLAENGTPDGSIAFLITGDEEGPAINGTKRVLETLAAEGETFDHCLVGEPTNPDALGDEVKIGRRGSLNGHLTVRGTQGHVAYPHRANNPVPAMLAALTTITAEPLDSGSDYFQPSNLEVSTVDVGNQAVNVIPAEVEARFNIRYNDLWNNPGGSYVVDPANDPMTPTPGTGEISVDPLFVDPLAGDYHLAPASPAIDAGDQAGCTDLDGQPLLSDQRGEPRPVDCGVGPRCDIGAYEGCGVEPGPIVGVVQEVRTVVVEICHIGKDSLVHEGETEDVTPLFTIGLGHGRGVFCQLVVTCRRLGNVKPCFFEGCLVGVDEIHGGNIGNAHLGASPIPQIPCPFEPGVALRLVAGVV